MSRYSICDQRSSGVNLDISGRVYFNGLLDRALQARAPASVGLRSELLHRARFRRGFEPEDAITSERCYRIIYQPLRTSWCRRARQRSGRQLLPIPATAWAPAGAARIRATGNFVVINSNVDVVWMRHRQFGSHPAQRDDGQIAVYADERQSALVECARPFSHCRGAGDRRITLDAAAKAAARDEDTSPQRTPRAPLKSAQLSCAVNAARPKQTVRTAASIHRIGPAAPSHLPDATNAKRRQRIDRPNNWSHLRG